MYIATRRARLEAREAGFLVQEIRTIQIQIGINYWDLEKCRKS